MLKTRGVWIYGNWKMNHTQGECNEYFKNLGQLWFKSVTDSTKNLLLQGRLQSTLFVPHLSLETAVEQATQFPIQVGAQNAHFEKKGAFTGEISGPMLSEIRVTKVLVGHSERRQFFGETDETVRRRVESLLEQAFQVTLCIGETLDERKAEKTNEVLKRQLTAVFSSQDSFARKALLNLKLLIAYEPVWAIGTGLTATPEQAEQAHQTIRKFIWDSCGIEASGKVPILYGGSVTPDNLSTLLTCPNIDGALIGGASLTADKWVSILESASKILQ